MWPAEVMGVNAMVAFVGSGVMARVLGAIKVGEPVVGLNRWMYEHWFAMPERAELGSLLFALATLGFWWLILWSLSLRGWVWRV
jgi:predicted acyltransferase